jgi:predicted RNA-binding protein with PIN domain
MTSVGDEVERPADADVGTAGVGPRPIAGLPATVRARIVEWAADVMGGAAPRELPATLQKVARFAPAKRARLAGSALADAVQQDEVFRAMVAEHAARLGTDVSVDPSAAAARAVLLRAPDADDLLAQAAAAQDQADARTRVGELEREVRSLTARLARAEQQLAAQVAAPPVEPGAEADRLRKRLRDQGTRLRELQDRLAAERADATAQQQVLAAQLDRTRAEAQAWRQRAEAAADRADAASAGMRRLRETTDDRRAADDRRLDLLLGVLESAAAGLRREWNLIGGGPAPADMVAAQLPEPATDHRTTDPVRLTLWAGMPGAHLIVDGYNVSKTGFPELVLADQRERLVRRLAAFAARTSAETTVVFDGAAVATTRPFARGVRVLFSPPGVQADDVIADLVRAEPVGRVVIVVSTDRRVADDAVGAGARSAPSSVLLAAIGGTST